MAMVRHYIANRCRQQRWYESCSVFVRVSISMRHDIQPGAKSLSADLRLAHFAAATGAGSASAIGLDQGWGYQIGKKQYGCSNDE